jgi:S-adenosylmethionine-dependent methyltransferase
VTIQEALQQAESIRDACASNPGLWNIVQAEHEWALHGDACDPLSPAAPERALKALQRDIYFEIWAEPLSRVSAGSRAMVAGGGTGRFAQVLAQRGFRVELVDASPEAVRRAQRHLGNSVPTSVGDLSHPGTLAPDAYDLLLAVEVPCYVTDPPRVMQHLRTALRSGGMMLFSVEARPGALLADRDLTSPDAVRAVLDEGVITLPGLKHVHYYTRAEAAELARNAGLSVLGVDGVCYVPDGPLGALLDAARLDEPAHVEQIRDIERRCRSHPSLRELPRAWAVAAVLA